MRGHRLNRELNKCHIDSLEKGEITEDLFKIFKLISERKSVHQPKEIEISYAIDAMVDHWRRYEHRSDPQLVERKQKNNIIGFFMVLAKSAYIGEYSKRIKERKNLKQYYLENKI